MTLLVQVDFVPGYGEADVVPQHLSELLDPVLDFGEAVSVCDVVDEHSAVGITVVDWTQGMKPLLACRVPDRQVDAFSP